MPIIKSAIKRMHQAAKAKARNQQTKRNLKAAIKSFTTKMTGLKLSEAQSEIDKAVKKNLLSKSAAARKKIQLVKAAKAAGMKVGAKTATKAPEAKAPVKKTAAKKAPVAKKPVTKKPAAKKPTTKK